MNCKITNNTQQDFSSLEKLMNDFFPFAQKQIGFNKPVDVVLQSSLENSEDPLGKTGYYDPSAFQVVIFTDNRHPKDILRSLSHELVHHGQNCAGKFDDMGPTSPGYAQSDPHLRSMEEDAFLRGNMIFRDWCDTCGMNENKIKINKNKINEIVEVITRDAITKLLEQKTQKKRAQSLADIFDEPESELGKLLDEPKTPLETLLGPEEDWRHIDPKIVAAAVEEEMRQRDLTHRQRAQLLGLEGYEDEDLQAEFPIQQTEDPYYVEPDPESYKKYIKIMKALEQGLEIQPIGQRIYLPGQAERELEKIVHGAGKNIAAKMRDLALEQDPEVEEVEPVATAVPVVTTEPKEYIVVLGDNLETIAKNNGCSMQAILDANTQIANPDYLNIGDKLVIPNCEPGEAEGVQETMIYETKEWYEETLYKKLIERYTRKTK